MAAAGRQRMAWWRRGWTVPALLFAAGAALRLWLAGSPIYGDEAAHYYIARHLGATAANVAHADQLPGQLFAARPAFFLLLAPGAQFGFTGFRVEHALLSALLPVLAWALLRQLGARPLAAASAGAILAFHPWMVAWGSRVFPDSLMAVFALAGLLAHARGRPLLAGALLVGAVWTKETGIAVLAAVGLAVLWRAVRSGEAGLWPLRLDRPATALLAAGLLAPAPLVLSLLVLGARMPGWATTPLAWGDLDHAFLSSWMLAPVLVGLAWRRTRPWSALALLYPAFYLAYGLALGRGVSIWYFVASAGFATVAALLALDEAANRVASSRAAQAFRWSPAAAAALLLVPLALTPGAAALAAPASARPATDYADLAAQARAPDRLREAGRFVAGTSGLFVVDAGWFFVLYPFSEAGAKVGFAYGQYHGDLVAWAQAIERAANWTIVEVHDDIPLNVAVREVYHDCVRLDNGAYVAIAGQQCPGRESLLRAALLAHGGEL
jgi:hypothetical protein